MKIKNVKLQFIIHPVRKTDSFYIKKLGIQVLVRLVKVDKDGTFLKQNSPSSYCTVLSRWRHTIKRIDFLSAHSLAEIIALLSVIDLIN